MAEVPSETAAAQAPIMNTWAVVVIVIIVLLVFTGLGWIAYGHWQARRLGLPPPTLSAFIPFRKSEPSYGVQPAPGGVIGWFKGQTSKFRNRNNRTAVGAYEGASGPSARGQRGFGPLDPDEAWDSRVGNEADTYGPGGYYEEQELGLHPPRNDNRGRGLGATTEYGGGSSYDMNLAATPGVQPAGFGRHDEPERGRSQTRPGQALQPGAAGRNPFDDGAEPSNLSLRAVSPRPIDTAGAAAAKSGPKDTGSGDSPTERRSVFRENV